ncbi:hypothetical protein NRO40_18305 [Streptomyces changanensis]|uniref:Uncharacterized protein n=2 Tax=Streptomyces TaxID=1883 RepID=A0A100Y5B5_9ACTN|nr:hypothetical protein [Streptomyces kanasensis]KUH37966.1 hypothetical protein ATE80_15110 [Streptomyces kanasensis]UUS32570.1 hypothetical protein NRO40_18305 [Streptomyces changanensis]
MPRGEFRPGRLVVGLTGLVVAVVYGGGAAGSWEPAWYTVVPLLGGGLGLAAAAAWAGYRVRRRRAARAASRESTGAPAGTSGSQAIR